MRDSLTEAGFEIWYPAEAEVEPGQVWELQGPVRQRIEPRPQKVGNTKPARIDFVSTKESQEFKSKLNADLAELLRGEGQIAADFRKATVRKVSMDFGDAKIIRLSSTTQIAQTGVKAYDDEVNKIASGKSKHSILAAVVQSPSLVYELQVDDIAEFKANASPIRNLLAGEGTAESIDGKQVKWVVKATPNEEARIIAASRLSPGQVSDALNSTAGGFRITNMTRLNESFAVPGTAGPGLALSRLQRRNSTQYHIAKAEDLRVAFAFACRGYRMDVDGGVNITGTIAVQDDNGNVLTKEPLHSLSAVQEWRNRPSLEKVSADGMLEFLGLSNEKEVARRRNKGQADSPILFLVVLDQFGRKELPGKRGKIVIELKDGITQVVAIEELPLSIDWK